MVLFAIAAAGPWIGYQQITGSERKEEIGSAEQKLELLAALYGAWAVEPGHNGDAAQAPPYDRSLASKPGAPEWIHAVQNAGNAKFSIRPMKPHSPESGAKTSQDPGLPQGTRIVHESDSLTAEVDFPARGIVASASLTDSDVLQGSTIRSRVELFVLVLRTLLMITAGATLYRQLLWREAVQAELIRTREAAELATRAKSEFLANMSHELRTPLNAVIGFSEAIKLGIFGPIGSRYREYGGHILSSGAHLLQLVNDLLDLSKLESGRFELEEAATDIPGVIGAALRLVRPLAADAKVTLHEEIAPGLPRVYADERRLQQVLLNLTANAVKFTPPGGAICVSACEERGEFLIRVSDTGTGMAKDQIPLALEPFRQLNSQFRSKHQGTGLGLPIAKDLIELHGGTFAIKSEVGVGTTVTISLPPRRIIRDMQRPVSALHEPPNGRFVLNAVIRDVSPAFPD
jgi:signal transduction histidine kinase